MVIIYKIKRVIMYWYLLLFLLIILCSVGECCFGGSGSTSGTTGSTSGTNSGSTSGYTTTKSSHYVTSPTARPTIAMSDAAIKAATEALFMHDTNSVGSSITVNKQGKTSSAVNNDMATNPLFPAIPPAVLGGTTISRMRQLWDNYEAPVAKKETNTREEQSEKDRFLNAIVETQVMRELNKTLVQQGFIRKNLRSTLNGIWFGSYSRGGGKKNLGSSGFEHVFLGEIKQGQVSGFHNWIFFYDEERKGNINYKGYMRSVPLGTKGEILKIRFDWGTHTKPVGSMFVGTSPELEIAVYTLCFYARPNKDCKVQMGGQNFRIKVYTQFGSKGKLNIGSAFPLI